MMNDVRIHERLSDLLYREMLGLTSDEESAELEDLLERFHLKGLEREKIIARLEEKDIFDGGEAYGRFKQLKSGRKSPWIWWYGIAASIAVLVAAVLWLSDTPEQVTDKTLSDTGVIAPGHSLAIVTLTNGQEFTLEKSTREIEESDGTILHSNAGELVYTATNKNAGAELMYNKVTIPRGGEYRLELSDGTRVWLNAETELRFPVHFSGDTREVYLKGEAYFEVKKDREHAFFVHTSMGVVKVLGTSFNVRDYPDEQEVVTTLEAGKIAYHSESPGEEVTLQPGYQVMDKKLNPLEVRKVDPLQYTGWREGKYVFEDVALEDIMRTLARWYDIEVVYADPAVKGLHFTGDLERYGSINVFLNFIETGGDVKFKTEGKVVIIDKK